MSLDNGPCKLVTLQIPRTHERIDPSRLFYKTYTVGVIQVYEVEFQLDRRSPHSICKRYREFRELHKAVGLIQVTQLDMKLDGFPERKWFGKLRTNVVERRRVMLEHWLLEFPKHRMTLPLLLDFLEVLAVSSNIQPSSSQSSDASPEMLPHTVSRLVEQASLNSFATEALGTLRKLVTSDNFQVRQTSVREFLSQSITSWKRMLLHTRLLDPKTRSDALSLFKVISESGQFEKSQLSHILHDDQDAFRLFVSWQEGSEDTAESDAWKLLENGADELEVAFRVKNETLEMRVTMWVRTTLNTIITTITNCESRKRWDERLIECWEETHDSQPIIHFEILVNGQPHVIKMQCAVVVKGDNATVEYVQVDKCEPLYKVSSYKISAERAGRLRHSSSTGDASTGSETYRINYTMVHSAKAARELLPDLMNAHDYIKRTWQNLKEFLELGYSSRRCSEVLPPRTLNHRSIAGSQDIMRQLVQAL